MLEERDKDNKIKMGGNKICKYKSRYNKKYKELVMGPKCLKKEYINKHRGD